MPSINGAYRRYKKYLFTYLSQNCAIMITESEGSRYNVKFRINYVIPKNDLKNYYSITVNLVDVDDYILTKEEAKQLSKKLKEFMEKQFGFEDDYKVAGEVISIEIKGYNNG